MCTDCVNKNTQLEFLYPGTIEIYPSLSLYSLTLKACYQRQSELCFIKIHSREVEIQPFGLRLSQDFTVRSHKIITWVTFKHYDVTNSESNAVTIQFVNIIYIYIYLFHFFLLSFINRHSLTHYINHVHLQDIMCE